jgi:hypothetical protein
MFNLSQISLKDSGQRSRHSSRRIRPQALDGRTFDDLVQDVLSTEFGCGGRHDGSQIR